MPKAVVISMAVKRLFNFFFFFHINIHHKRFQPVTYKKDQARLYSGNILLRKTLVEGRRKISDDSDYDYVNVEQSYESTKYDDNSDGGEYAASAYMT